MYKVEYVDENMASIILCAWKRMLYFVYECNDSGRYCTKFQYGLFSLIDPATL